jgi:hypothetical protein
VSDEPAGQSTGTTEAGLRRRALGFVVFLGVVSLFADMTYEGARSITGPFLALLGASGAVVGFVAGLGELIGYGLRLGSGYLADRTKRYWGIAIFGYALNLLAVPAIALAGRWEVGALLMIAERTVARHAERAANTLCGRDLGLTNGDQVSRNKEKPGVRRGKRDANRGQVEARGAVHTAMGPHARPAQAGRMPAEENLRLPGQASGPSCRSQETQPSTAEAQHAPNPDPAEGPPRWRSSWCISTGIVHRPIARRTHESIGALAAGPVRSLPDPKRPLAVRPRVPSFEVGGAARLRVRTDAKKGRRDLVPDRFYSVASPGTNERPSGLDTA